MPSSETSPAVVTGAAPSLGDLMPWGVAPLRLGRGWVMAPDRASLTARWDALLKAEGPDREALFHATRSRTPHRPVGQLPGQRTGTLPLDREEGACPDPVRILHGAFDQQWLIPDHRLIDAARPELWRVADDRQIFALELGQLPRGAPAGPALVASTLLPDGRSPAGRPGRIRPLYRRPGGREPNLTPGLVPYLKLRLGVDVAPEDILAWALANTRSTPQGSRVPLTADPAVWQAGVELGHRILDLHLRGARSDTKPRLPGGRRPYVRAAVPARPDGYGYQGPYEPEPDQEIETDTESAARPPAESLHLGTGLISPVPPTAWDFTIGGVRVLEHWLATRIDDPADPGTLAAIRPTTWPQDWTSELLELITILALLAELPEQPHPSAPITAYDLRQAGVLPPPAAATRPASVLDHHEEGPAGQAALV